MNYTVTLGGTEADYRAESLELNTGDYTVDTLTANLKYLPSLSKVHFPKMSMDAQTLFALREAYPEIAFSYTVNLFGKELPGDTASLDLTDMTSKDVEALTEVLPLLTQLQEVQLSETLTMEEVFRITPLPRLIMPSVTARIAFTAPFTFRSITLS